MPPVDVAVAQHERILLALDRLLYDARTRAAFTQHGPRCAELALDDRLVEVFGRVDTRELTQVGRNIRNAVTSGGTGTGLGLTGAFPRTLKAVQARTGDELHAIADRFIASSAFQDFRDVPYSPHGRGRTLAECFHRWVADAPVLTSDRTLEPLAFHEAATAVVQTFAAGADATFDVGMPGAAVHGGTLCLFRDYAQAPPDWHLQPTMYLAGNARCLVGTVQRPMYESLVAVLRGDGDTLEDRVRDALERRLRSWGLR